MKTKKRVLLLLAATLLVYTSFLPVSAQTTVESDPVPYIEGEGENTDPSEPETDPTPIPEPDPTP